MNGRNWKNLEPLIVRAIHKYLAGAGGVPQEVKNEHESWRIRLADATFTYYKTGTLYSTPSNSGDKAVGKAWNEIDRMAGSRYVSPDREFLIGMDETGKGEIIGPTLLTAVNFPRTIFKELDLVIGPADTKKRHGLDYWDALYRKLDGFREKGLDFLTEEISPARVDEFKLNQVMDDTYRGLLETFLPKLDISRCRIVIDDYGVGAGLKGFLQDLKTKKAKVVVATNSEDSYLETKAASLIAKKQREVIIARINQNPKFIVDGISPGSGNAGDRQTLDWLKKWYRSGKPWPWFVRRSFKTVREIEGKTGKVQKSSLNSHD